MAAILLLCAAVTGDGWTYAGYERKSGVVNTSTGPLDLKQDPPSVSPQAPPPGKPHECPCQPTCNCRPCRCNDVAPLEAENGGLKKTVGDYAETLQNTRAKLIDAEARIKAPSPPPNPIPAAVPSPAPPVAPPAPAFHAVNGSWQYGYWRADGVFQLIGSPAFVRHAVPACASGRCPR